MATRPTTPKVDPKHVIKGVDQAMWAWIMENSPVTLPGLVETAVERSFDAWLEINKVTLLELIAEKIARRMEDEGKGPV